MRSNAEFLERHAKRKAKAREEEFRPIQDWYDKHERLTSSSAYHYASKERKRKLRAIKGNHTLRVFMPRGKR